jgi:hypothetical protein
MVAREPCGSEAAYQRHRRSKEAPCATCTDAHRKYTNTHNYPSPAPDGRAASPGQVVRVRELSRALLGDQRTVEAALGKPGDANRWSGVRASTVITALLELEDLSFSHRLPADPVGWLRSRMNGGITVEVSS